MPAASFLVASSYMAICSFYICSMHIISRKVMMYFSSLEDVMLIIVSLQCALVACYSDAAQLQVFVVIEEPRPR
jgi:hypothetical protein